MDESLDVPTLTGEGLILRAWGLSDLELVREASVDEYIPLITTVPSLYSETEGVAFVERQWGRAARRAGYPFVIVREGDGRPVGNVGLWLGNLGQGRASLGYWIAPSARGQGLSALALRMVSSWALQELRVPRLELYVEPWNSASVRTAEKAGYVREGLLRSWQEVGDQRRDMYMYALINDGADTSCLQGT